MAPQAVPDETRTYSSVQQVQLHCHQIPACKRLCGKVTLEPLDYRRPIVIYYIYIHTAAIALTNHICINDPVYRWM